MNRQIVFKKNPKFHIQLGENNDEEKYWQHQTKLIWKQDKKNLFSV